MDCKTQCSDTYFLWQKSELQEVFEKYWVLKERETGHSILWVRCDRAPENVGELSGLKGVCDELGIQMEVMPAYTKEQDGVEERYN